MALEGTLRDFSLADIFQLIGLQRKTGVLTLRSKDDTVTVTFLDGKVDGADSLSHRLENRLGHVLIRSNLLTQDQLNRALEIQKETLQRLGFILTHYGIISIDALKQASSSRSCRSSSALPLEGRRLSLLAGNHRSSTTATTSFRSAPNRS
jgi:hypothetical protein